MVGSGTVLGAVYVAVPVSNSLESVPSFPSEGQLAGVVVVAFPFVTVVVVN
jgi:hypothetical protein